LGGEFQAGGVLSPPEAMSEYEKESRMALEIGHRKRSVGKGAEDT